MKKWFRTSKAIVMYLSNGTLQVCYKHYSKSVSCILHSFLYICDSNQNFRKLVLLSVRMIRNKVAEFQSFVKIRSIQICWHAHCLTDFLRRHYLYAIHSQVNFFEDHTKIILSNECGRHCLTFIDETRKACTYLLEDIASLGCTDCVYERMDYARNMLQNIIDIEGETI